MRYKHFVLTKFNIRQEFDCRLKNPDYNPMLKILDEEYLEERFEIFEKYTLQSMKNQTNQNFKWIVLFHEDTPKKFLNKIKELKKTYEFMDIYVEDGGWFNFTVYCNNNNENCDFYITTRIDNDDMFDEDYIKIIQDFADDNLHKCILSFPYGEKLDLETKKHYKSIVKDNHFLSMISPKEDHILSYNHAKILDSDNEIIFLESNKPMWTEIVHKTNVINNINLEEDVETSVKDLNSELLDLDVATFAVSGSCASRDIFYSKINQDYKKFFKITGDGVRISFISLMSTPIECDENLLKILPETQNNINYSNWIKRDLNKTFINVLKEKDFEYILIDTYYDVHEGIVDLGDNIYITNNIGLDRTEFFKNLSFKEVLQIQNNTPRYFRLWKEYFDLFINFVDKTCPDSKIILNTNRMVYRIIDSNSNIKISEEFKKHCNLNKYRDLLDEYIIKNFDIELLKFDKNTLVDENHIWGPHPLHFIPEYFDDMNSQLNKIIFNNNSRGEYENKNRRKLDRIQFLNDLKENEDLINLKINQNLY